LHFLPEAAALVLIQAMNERAFIESAYQNEIKRYFSLGYKS
jgi:S-adenosylmethionine:tRNA-ribosyltransferase-isomerase (queuine synthetase)